MMGARMLLEREQTIPERSCVASSPPASRLHGATEAWALVPSTLLLACRRTGFFGVLGLQGLGLFRVLEFYRSIRLLPYARLCRSPSPDGVCRLAQRQEQWCWRAIAAGLPDRLPQRLRARPSPTPVRRYLLTEPRAQCEGRPGHGRRRRRRARRIRERGRTALDGGGVGGADGDARQAALLARENRVFLPVLVSREVLQEERGFCDVTVTDTEPALALARFESPTTAMKFIRAQRKHQRLQAAKFWAAENRSAALRSSLTD